MIFPSGDFIYEIIAVSFRCDVISKMIICVIIRDIKEGDSGSGENSFFSSWYLDK